MEKLAIKLTHTKIMEDTKDTALYIKFNGRGWAIWHHPQEGLMAIPEDEEEFGHQDLSNLAEYLENEGWFSEYFAEGGDLSFGD